MPAKQHDVLICFLFQVRAAMPGMPVSEQNCHPFQWGRYMWMHNGMVGCLSIHCYSSSCTLLLQYNFMQAVCNALRMLQWLRNNYLSSY